MPATESKTKIVSPQIATTLARSTMIKLGSKVTDAASAIKGMVTLLAVELDGSRNYCFQPSGLDKETKQPLSAYWIVPARIKGGEIVPEPELPFEILGTEVQDTATPFKGMAVSFVLFMSGCVHVCVQPKGTMESGGMIKSYDFDIRRLKGKFLKEMTEKQKAEDIKEKPSPMSYERHERSIPGQV